MITNRISIRAIVFALLILIVLVWPLRSPWLTFLYGEEMRAALQRYFDVIGTLEGQLEPEIIEQVATGPQLERLVRVRCKQCDRVQVLIRSQVVEVQVLDYEPPRARVKARLEYGWHHVNPKTGLVVGPCHAQAFTFIPILVRETGVWKVSEIGDVDLGEVHPVDDTPELRSKYCPAE